MVFKTTTYSCSDPLFHKSQCYHCKDVHHSCLIYIANQKKSYHWIYMYSISYEVLHKHVVCCCSGSPNQFIGVYNTSGDNLSTIKYHEGFLGQRIGAASCLAFHPYKVHNSSRQMLSMCCLWCVVYGLNLKSCTFLSIYLNL